MNKTPSADGLSIQSQHRHRNPKDLEVLHYTGIGISNDRVNITTTITCDEQEKRDSFQWCLRTPGASGRCPNQVFNRQHKCKR